MKILGKFLPDRNLMAAPLAVSWLLAGKKENAERAANIEVESVILEGSLLDKIVDFAEKNIDLIIMGIQGKNVIQIFLNVSVENVVRHSSKIVLVVRGETVEKGK